MMHMALVYSASWPFGNVTVIVTDSNMVGMLSRLMPSTSYFALGRSIRFLVRISKKVECRQLTKARNPRGMQCLLPVARELRNLVAHADGQELRTATNTKIRVLDRQLAQSLVLPWSRKVLRLTRRTPVLSPGPRSHSSRTMATAPPWIASPKRLPLSRSP